MLQELLIVIVVFAAIVCVIDHLRRLLVAISLNRTIREAIRHHPESVGLLVEKLEMRAPLPLALGGWVFLGLGLLCLITPALGDGEVDREAMLAATLIAALGVGLLVAARWVGRSGASAPESKI